MPIVTEHVERYLKALRPARSAVMSEMEALAERERIPIVHWETGRLLAALCRALDPVVLEVGTAIGYSTLHMAEQLDRGRVVTLELSAERVRQAEGFLERAGLSSKVEVIEGDARETIPRLEGPFDLLFIDAAKDEYGDYLRLAEPKLTESALLVIDNMLMHGEVALRPGSDTYWSPEALRSARALAAELVTGDRWLGAVLSVGDGVGLAARRPAST